MATKTRVLCEACSGDVGLWQAAFTSECDHTFHLRCVSGSASCPVCAAKWSYTPATAPAPVPATPFSFASTSTSPPKGLFGQQGATTNSFTFTSSSQTTSSLFGSSPQTSSSLFGSSPQTASSSSLFASSPQTASSFSLFGSSPQTTRSFSSSFIGAQTTSPPPAMANSSCSFSLSFDFEPSPFGWSPQTTATSSLLGSSQQTTSSSSLSGSSPQTASGSSLSGSSPQTASGSLQFGSSSSSALFSASQPRSSPPYGRLPQTTSSSSLFGSSRQTTSSSSIFTMPSLGSSPFGPQPPATPNPFWPLPTSCSVCHGVMHRGQATVTSECNHTFHIRCFSGSVCPVCKARWRDEVTVTPPSPLKPSSSPPQPSGFQRPIFKFTPPPNPSFITSPYQCPSRVFNFDDDEPVEAPLDGWDTVPEAASNGVLVLETYCEHPAVARDAAQDNFAVLVHAKAPVAAVEASERAPLDLVTVLDVSGSMAGSKLALLKQAMGFVIDKLGPGDRLSIVTFSCNACRIIRLTRMSDGGKASAKGAVESLRANGNTNIGDGLRVAAQVLGGRRHKNAVSSVILLSDGQDNHTLKCAFGPYSGSKNFIDLVPDSLRRGDGNPCTPVHTFGFGTDHDARAMHAIAEVTGGTFSFIENQAVVQDSFAQCIGGLLSVAVQEARVAVECLHPGVGVRAIKSGRYESRVEADGRAASVDVGELYAEEERRFLLLVEGAYRSRGWSRRRRRHPPDQGELHVQGRGDWAARGRCRRGRRGAEAGGGGRHGAMHRGRA